MKVKELIRQLEELDGEKEIGILSNFDSVEDLQINENEFADFEDEKFDYYID